jgi:hypothetical protein
VTLLAGLLANAAGYAWLLRAVGFIVPGLLIAETPLQNVMLVSIMFGVAFSGWTIIRSALLLKRLPPGAPITYLPIFEQQRGWRTPLTWPETPLPAASSGLAGERLIVHVWTPLASTADPRRRPLLDRYIAAVDRQGTVATGHAALELTPDLYISHYRAEEQDRSPGEFRRAIHSGVQNNVPGRFLPSYREEAAGWCQSTAKVTFQHFNAVRLRVFWDTYRRDATYNLTNRNCSVAVVMALDAALEGVLGDEVVWPPFLRLLVHPELYLATLLRKRARTMTWTPGLVLDYARALHHVVEPPPVSWIGLLRQARDGYRRLRRERGRALPKSAA